MARTFFIYAVFVAEFFFKINLRNRSVTYIFVTERLLIADLFYEKRCIPGHCRPNPQRNYWYAGKPIVKLKQRGRSV